MVYHEEGISSDDEIPETNRLKFVSDTGQDAKKSHLLLIA